MYMAGMKHETEKHSKFIILLMIILLTVHLLVPFASADGMTSCPAYPGGPSGSCDDYNGGHDITPDHQDWVNGTYDFQLIDTETIELDLVWAIHEFNRSALGFDDGGDIESALAADGLGPEDGAPADMIRHYFNLRPDGPETPTVKERLKSELNDALDTAMSTGFGDITGQTTGYSNSINQNGTTTTCSDDPTEDSVYSSEGQTENSVFHPPICLSSTFTIELTDTAFSMDSSGNLDLERAFQGLMVMGAEITTNFTLLTLPGHIGYYSFEPPEIAVRRLVPYHYLKVFRHYTLHRPS